MRILKTANYKKISDFNEDQQAFTNRCLNTMEQSKQVVSNFLSNYGLDLMTYKNVIKGWDQNSLNNLLQGYLPLTYRSPLKEFVGLGRQMEIYFGRMARRNRGEGPYAISPNNYDWLFNPNQDEEALKSQWKEIRDLIDVVSEVNRANRRQRRSKRLKEERKYNQDPENYPEPKGLADHPEGYYKLDSEIDKILEEVFKDGRHDDIFPPSREWYKLKDILDYKQGNDRYVEAFERESTSYISKLKKVYRTVKNIMQEKGANLGIDVNYELQKINKTVEGHNFETKKYVNYYNRVKKWMMENKPEQWAKQNSPDFRPDYEWTRGYGSEEIDKRQAPQIDLKGKL
jgi:hypothetical protein